MLESIEKLRRHIGKCMIVQEPWTGMVDEIEREVECGYMRLPVDADGEPIHVGDKLHCVDFRIEAHAVSPERVYYWSNDYDGEGGEFSWTKAVNCRHVKQPTVEDVLREYHHQRDEIGKAYIEGNLLIGERHRKVDELTAEYADKLREAVRREDD